MDRREEILFTKKHPTPGSVTIGGAKDAMDEYMKECCLELIQFMIDRDVFVTRVTDEVTFLYYRGEYITKEQFFELFL